MWCIDRLKSFKGKGDTILEGGGGFSDLRYSTNRKHFLAFARVGNGAFAIFKRAR